MGGIDKIEEKLADNSRLFFIQRLPRNVCVSWEVLINTALLEKQLY